MTRRKKHYGIERQDGQHRRLARPSKIARVSILALVLTMAFGFWPFLPQSFGDASAFQVHAAEGLSGPGGSAKSGGETLEIRAASLEQVGGAQQLTVTVAVKNAVFNVVQFSLEYDSSRLSPADEANRETDSAKRAAEILAPVYDSAEYSGWLASGIPSNLDKQKGILEYTLYVEPASNDRYVENGSYEEGGFVRADGSGENLLRLRFRVKDGNGPYLDSLRAGSTKANPTGLSMVVKAGEGVEERTGADRIRIDLSAAASGKTPGGWDNGGNSADSGSGSEDSSGSGSGDSSGSGSGGSGPVNGNSGSGSFSDVSGHWARQAIQNLTGRGILSGYPDGTFRPNASLTRAELASALAKIKPDPGNTGQSQTFSDVKGTHWSAASVGTVSRAGWMSGYPDGTFGPGRNVTRQELASIVVRAAGLDGKGSEQGQDTAAGSKPFSDDAKIAGWARSAVYTAKEGGLLSGDPDGAFRPGDPVSRAELSAVLEKLLER